MNTTHHLPMIFESSKAINNNQALAPIGFVEAVFQGLAPDGGLYSPLEYANLANLIQSLPRDISFVDIASTITHALFSNEFSHEQARQLCVRAFPFSPKLQILEDDITLLELFHGPSCAFKDFGASYLAAVMEHELENNKKSITILTATSGDTGSAVAQAFHNKAHIKVVILYPSGRVSPLQEKQLTSVGDNIHAIEVAGSFDDCQDMVKNAFADSELRKRFGLSSANSINIGRLVPQSLYYIYAWNQLRHSGRDDWIFCTPSGNFGNLTAGLLAKNWGLPLPHIIAACNTNDVVPKYLQTGKYAPKPSLATLANAMDVGRPSNFERMHTMYLQRVRAMDDLQKDKHSGEYSSAIHKKMESEIRSLSINDEEIRTEILRIFKRTGQFICPHTAVGVRASKQVLESKWAKENNYGHAVVLSTAHSGKFFEVIEDICGTRPLLPPRLEEFLHKDSFAHKCEATLEELTKILETL